MTNPPPADRSGVSVDDVIITAELSRRPSRPPDHAAENRALVDLAQAMAASPQTTLQRLADTTLRLCRANSAGVRLDEVDGNRPVFRWRATAGPSPPSSATRCPATSAPAAPSSN